MPIDDSSAITPSLCISRFAPFYNCHQVKTGIVYDGIFAGSMILDKLVNAKCGGLADLVALRGIVKAMAYGMQDALEVVSMLVNAHKQEEAIVVVTNTKESIRDAIVAKGRIEKICPQQKVKLYVEKKLDTKSTGLFPIDSLKDEALGEMEFWANTYVPCDHFIAIEGCSDFRFCLSKLKLIREQRPVAFIFLPGGVRKIAEKVFFFVEAERIMLEEFSVRQLLCLGHQDCAALKDLHLESIAHEYDRQMELIAAADQVRAESNNPSLPFSCGYEWINEKMGKVALAISD